MEGDILMRKKTLTKKQYQENIEKIFNFAATLLVAAFCFAVIIFSLPL